MSAPTPTRKEIEAALGGLVGGEFGSAGGFYGRACARLLAKLNAERTAHTEMRRRLQELLQSLQYNMPFPIPDILLHLANAAEHLLIDHNCDIHGYETWIELHKLARAIAPHIREEIRAVTTHLKQAKETEG